MSHIKIYQQPSQARLQLLGLASIKEKFQSEQMSQCDDSLVIYARVRK